MLCRAGSGGSRGKGRFFYLSVASTGRGLMAPPVSNCHRWSSWRSWRRSCPCRVPTWCATRGVWRRIASSGRRSFPPRASRMWTASKRRQEPPTRIGRGYWVVSLIWIWRPARCAAVAPCATASALGSYAALPCDLPTSHCAYPPPPRDIRVRRRPRRREPIGKVRTAAAPFTPLCWEIPFKIAPPRLSPTGCIHLGDARHRGPRECTE
jgi:hypothetical protein